MGRIDRPSSGHCREPRSGRRGTDDGQGRRGRGDSRIAPYDTNTHRAGRTTRNHTKGIIEYVNSHTPIKTTPGRTSQSLRRAADRRHRRPGAGRLLVRRYDAVVSLAGDAAFPRPVVREVYAPGAGANVADNLNALGVGHVTVFSVSGRRLARRDPPPGDDGSRHRCQRLLLTPAQHHDLHQTDAAGLQSQQEDARVDFENAAPLAADLEER